MAEIIDNDLLVKLLRYLNACQCKDIKTTPPTMRNSTYEVAIDLLEQQGLVTKEGRVTEKGRDFLTENKLTNTFKCEVSPFGVAYEHGDKETLDRLIDILEKRPKPDYTLDHQPLFPELTMMRAHYIASEENLYDKNVAFVGDYDSTNIALNLVTKVNKSTVFDIDKRLIKFFKKTSTDNQYDIKTVPCNIFEFDNKKYKNSFDVFITDPPYALKGMLSFINFSISMLKPNGVGYIATPYHHTIGWTERMLFEINKLLIHKDCVLTDIHKGFHSYQTADGLKSSMLRLVKGAKNKEIDTSKYYSYKKVNHNRPIISL